MPNVCLMEMQVLLGGFVLLQELQNPCNVGVKLHISGVRSMVLIDQAILPVGAWGSELPTTRFPTAA